MSHTLDYLIIIADSMKVNCFGHWELPTDWEAILWWSLKQIIAMIKKFCMPLHSQSSISNDHAIANYLATFIEIYV